MDERGAEGALLTGVYGSGKSSVAEEVRSSAEVQAVREALGVPLRVARLTVPFPDIERRLAGEVLTLLGWALGGD